MKYWKENEAFTDDIDHVLVIKKEDMILKNMKNSKLCKQKIKLEVFYFPHFFVVYLSFVYSNVTLVAEFIYFFLLCI